MCLPTSFFFLAMFASLIIRLFQLDFSAGTIFFSHNKSAGIVFWLIFLAKRTRPSPFERGRLHSPTEQATIIAC